MKIIFETKRLLVRGLKMKDLELFHLMQSNPNVMRFVRGKGMTRMENEKELPELIKKYDKENNDFWVYAIIRKNDSQFVGTVALVKDDDGDDEIGYRFLESEWGKGYGYEVCVGLLGYCRLNGFRRLVAYVADENVVSEKIVKKCGFCFIKKGIEPKLQLPETKYQIIL